MAAIFYDTLIYMGAACGLASILLTLACFIGRRRWTRNRLVFGVVLELVLCSVCSVCVMWSIAVDVQEGDWQTLIDTVPYWAACLAGVVAFGTVLGVAVLSSPKEMDRSL